MHDADPFELPVVSGQSIQLSTTWAVTSLNFPEAQLEQLWLPLETLYVPAAQGKQEPPFGPVKPSSQMQRTDVFEASRPAVDECADTVEQLVQPPAFDTADLNEFDGQAAHKTPSPQWPTLHWHENRVLLSVVHSAC